MDKDLRSILRGFMRRAESRYNQLMQSENIRENVVGEDDVVTRMDQAMLELAREYFKEPSRKNVFCLQSEEKAKEKNPSYERDPDYTVILDEIDGTSNFAEGSGPHGPVLGIAAGGPDPDFEDMEVAGFLNMQDGHYYEASISTSTGGGAFRSESGVPGEERYEDSLKKINSGDRASLDPGAVVAVDKVLEDDIHDLFSEYRSMCCGSAACTMAYLAEGKIDAYVAGRYPGGKNGNSMTPKTGEEIGPFYLILKEAGASVFDWNSEEIGGEKIGMYAGKGHNFVATSSPEMAEEVLEMLDKAS